MTERGAETPPAAIIRALTAVRLPLTSERATGDAIAAVLADAGIAFARERRLEPFGVIDFLAGRIGIEVKLGGAGHPGGGARAIYRQVRRYLEHPGLDGLVLATNRALSLPDLGKPVIIVSLGRAWL